MWLYRYIISRRAETSLILLPIEEVAEPHAHIANNNNNKHNIQRTQAECVRPKESG